MIEKITQISALFASFVILNGIIYLSIYYQTFGIGIFSYLDFSEVITAFIDRIKMTLLFFAFYLLIACISFIIGLSEGKKQLESTDEEKNNFENNLFRIQKISLILNLFIAIIFITLLILDFLILRTWLIYYFTFTVISIFQYATENIKRHFSEILRTNSFAPLVIVTFILLPFTMGTIAFAFYESFDKSRNLQSIELVDKEKNKMVIDSNFKFVGKTKNYVFLHDFQTEKSMSVSLDNIEKIIYK